MVRRERGEEGRGEELGGEERGQASDGVMSISCWQQEMSKASQHVNIAILDMATLPYMTWPT